MLQYKPALILMIIKNNTSNEFCLQKCTQAFPILAGGLGQGHPQLTHFWEGAGRAKLGSRFTPALPPPAPHSSHWAEFARGQKKRKNNSGKYLNWKRLREMITKTGCFCSALPSFNNKVRAHSRRGRAQGRRENWKLPREGEELSSSSWNILELGFIPLWWGQWGHWNGAIHPPCPVPLTWPGEARSAGSGASWGSGWCKCHHVQVTPQVSLCSRGV